MKKQKIFFSSERHKRTSFQEEPKLKREEWKTRSKTRTVIGILVTCLNIGIEPPNVIKPDPCCHLECWVDPRKYTKDKAMILIGRNLQLQFVKFEPRARYKQCLDPPFEELKRVCQQARKYGIHERVLFYYNGHGVPKPTKTEIWVFNDDYTQYIPSTIRELRSWIGSPSIYVFDCSSAGILADNFIKTKNKKADKKEKISVILDETTKSMTLETIVLFSCSAYENLPTDSNMPADLFTSCLTTPIKIALRWHVCSKFSSNTLLQKIDLEMLENIPGKLSDRSSLLGELNWIFTSITDTIAWNTLSNDYFQKLYRQDLMIASLFRNFLLAERVMKSYNCTPFTIPLIPETYKHDLWNSWDYVVDSCLSQLSSNEYNLDNTLGGQMNSNIMKQSMKIPFHKSNQVNNSKNNRGSHGGNNNNSEYSRGNNNNNKGNNTSQNNNKNNNRGSNNNNDPRKNIKKRFFKVANFREISFFNDQLTSFQVWLDSGRNQKIGIGQLPIILQVLLSQSHRKRALVLLARFLDLGPWAVNKALSVGIFPYILRLLKSPATELRSVLVFIWAKVLAFERTCQASLTKDNSNLYFINILSSPTVDQDQYSLSAFALSIIQSDFPQAKLVCHRSNILQICLSRLEDQDPNVRRWICLCLAKYWEDFEKGKTSAIREGADKILTQLLNDNVPEVRASAIYALSTFLSGSKGNTKKSTENINCEMKIALALIGSALDASPLVRHECLLTAIKMIVLYYKKVKKSVKQMPNYGIKNQKIFNSKEFEKYKLKNHKKIKLNKRKISRQKTTPNFKKNIDNFEENLFSKNYSKTEKKKKKNKKIQKNSLASRSFDTQDIITNKQSNNIKKNKLTSVNSMGNNPRLFSKLRSPSKVNKQKKSFLAINNDTTTTNNNNNNNTNNNNNKNKNNTKRILFKNDEESNSSSFLNSEDPSDNLFLNSDNLDSKYKIDNSNIINDHDNTVAYYLWDCLIKFSKDPYPLIKNLAIEFIGEFIQFWKQCEKKKKLREIDYKYKILNLNNINDDNDNIKKKNSKKKEKMKKKKEEEGNLSDGDINKIKNNSKKTNLETSPSKRIKRPKTPVATTKKNKGFNSNDQKTEKKKNFDQVKIINKNKVKLINNHGKLTEKSHSFDMSVNETQKIEKEELKLEKEEFLKQIFKKAKSHLFDWCVSYFLKPLIYIKDEEGINQFPKSTNNGGLHQNKKNFNSGTGRKSQFQSNNLMNKNLSNFGSYNSFNYQGRIFNHLSLDLNSKELNQNQLNSKKKTSVHLHYYKKKWRKRLIDKTKMHSKILFSNRNNNDNNKNNPKNGNSDKNNNKSKNNNNKNNNNNNNSGNNDIDLSKLRIEEQISVLDSSLTKPLTNIIFHPFESYYIATDGYQKVYLVNWSKQPSEIINSFENGNSNNKNISSLSLINDENDALLMIGSNDGSIRIWKNITGKKKENKHFFIGTTSFSTLLNNTDSTFSKYNSLYKSKMGFNNLTVPYPSPDEPELASNWLALPELELRKKQKSGYGMVVEWNQDKGEIIASGGSSRVIKIWDAEYERIKLHFSTSRRHPITSIKSSQNSVLYAGASDGSVLLYDTRDKNNSGLIMKFLVHDSPIINVCTQKKNKGQLISGSEDGGIRLWDTRNHSPIWSLSTTTKEIMTTMDVHNMGPFIATGSKSHFVNVYDLDGQLISNGKRWKELNSAKMGLVHSVKFHPYRPLLCVGTDLNTSVFSPIDLFKKK
ncbi:regulatory-associated protein of mtor [Anaeramoeba flamelloides]|uniref:Regulatory-associated protein of mtor n=1 Tax=Anaeramoeba flamelloides TaxID=1746091 RepID=A0ABQ8XLL2_9EUKA|nr:regulatory-associated protein of mtor [Anaeramoeba flamelloides]